MDCTFCKISQKKIDCDIIFEDNLTICFRDINPVAPVHLLMIPKVHIPSVFEIGRDNSAIISRIFENISKISSILCNRSCRIVNNNGIDALQTVKHLHFHILGGARLGWPPC
ncbi:MAG: histidine triad nucleotide-binding protein [Candidatus Improbicoccus pseudotrichonymphae]|uniref:Histidine triad nucleotide-binding protein n=1 Tax=Candidatus Improbicoccus pseudotrichonymphae TaxID=3033792 RepID=A0AA48HXZ0_9FIRM|nr:MAG: histidine triad nucleotide-binding protein [Candidatus Improbicoccus pseudotrichonymphae]